jgi:hypothetical protein
MLSLGSDTGVYVNGMRAFHHTVLEGLKTM